MSKTTKIMDILGKYECVRHCDDTAYSLWLYFKSTDYDEDGRRHNHKRLLGKYSSLGAVLADIMDSMNNHTFWDGNWNF